MNKYTIVKSGNVISLLAIYTLMAVLVLASDNRANNIEHQYLVQQACDATRISNNFESCYKLEGKYNIEYICNKTSCWSEVK